jgi:hypothetical protein
MSQKKQFNTPSLLGANLMEDEIEVPNDWRYHLVLPYMRQSSSYIAVRDKYRGKKIKKSELPKDEKLVYEVAHWFDILSVEADDEDSTEWWERDGKLVYGFNKELPVVTGTFMKPRPTRTLAIGHDDIPMYVMQIPATLTYAEAFDGIRRAFAGLIKEYGTTKLGQPLPDSYKSHYQLFRSKLRKATLIKGVQALSMYRGGIPLWKIGNDLELSPDNSFDEFKHDLHPYEEAQKKRVLSIMARRLVNTASLIAENAARGRFPSDKPFPEAMLDDFKRTAGRPIGSKPVRLT